MFVSATVYADERNLFTWFRGGEATVVTVHDKTHQLPKQLAEYIYSKFGTVDDAWHLTKEDIFKCYGNLSPEQYGYGLVLRKDGIGFQLPLTDNGSCGEEIGATFTELAPFMNAQGQAQVANIKKHQRKK